MRDVFRRICSLEKRVAQLISVGIVLKSDGIIPLAMKRVVNLHTIALSDVTGYATVSEVVQQYRRLQTRYFDILKCRLLNEWYGFIRLFNRQLHLLSDELRPFDEVCFSCQLPGKVEDVATCTASEIEP